MHCCRRGHVHKCKDCKYEDVDLFDDPCLKCVTCNPFAYQFKGECAFERKDVDKDE
jgi:hypothetical protein